MELWFVGDTHIDKALQIRRKVFIEEQQIPEKIEIDGTDKDCTHLVIEVDNIPVATGRIIVKDGLTYIGRVATIQEYRNQGYAKLVMDKLEAKLIGDGVTQVFVNAQSQVQDFYAGIGYKPIGKPFTTANIPHVRMMKNLSQDTKINIPNLQTINIKR